MISPIGAHPIVLCGLWANSIIARPKTLPCLLDYIAAFNIVIHTTTLNHNDSNLSILFTAVFPLLL